MRILQVSTLAGPGPSAGGVWRVVEAQVGVLRSRGEDVRVVAGWLGRLPPRSEQESHTILFRVHRFLSRKSLRFLWSAFAFRVLAAAVKDRDVVHVHFCRDFVTVLAAYFASIHGLPLVLQTHGMVTKPHNVAFRVFDTFFTRPCLRRADLILWLTTEERETLSMMGVEPSKLKQIFNAPSEVLNDEWHPEEMVLLFAARLHHRKRPSAFVEAAISLLASGVVARFAVMGPDQGELAKMRQTTLRSGYSDAFEFLGPCSHNEVLSKLARVRGLVLPSYNEPYPMVVLEAASMGTPFIITESCGFADLVRERKAGVVIGDDLSGLAASMRLLIEGGAEVSTMSTQCRALQRETWSLEGLGSTLTQTYSMAVLSLKESRA